MWLGDYRKFWEQSLDRLDAYVRELQAKERAAPQRKEKPDERPPRTKR